MELFGMCLSLKFQMKSMVLFPILIDPLLPDIDHVMMLLDHLIQLPALMDHVLLDVSLLNGGIHPFSFLPFLNLLRVNDSQKPSLGRILTNPSFQLGEAMVDEHRLRLHPQLLLQQKRRGQGVAFLALIQLLHYHQVFNLDHRLFLSLRVILPCLTPIP
jgi:hypothetical protein